MTNVIVIAGRLTADSTMQFTTTGSAICNFNLANNRKEASGEETTYIGVAVFGNYAEKMHPHLTKGVTVTVVGKLVQKEWTVEGKQVPTYKIYAKEIDFRIPKNMQPTFIEEKTRKGDDENE